MNNNSEQTVLEIIVNARLKQLRCLQSFLVIIPFLTCTIFAVAGNKFFDDHTLFNFSYAVEKIFWSADRLGSLAANPLLGEFCLSVGFVSSIPFFLSVFIYIFIQRSTKQVYEATNNVAIYIFIAVPILLLLSDFGAVDFVGLVSANGFYAHPDNFVCRLFKDSKNISLGVTCAIYALCTATLYGFAFGFGLKAFLVLIYKIKEEGF